MLFSCALFEYEEVTHKQDVLKIWTKIQLNIIKQVRFRPTLVGLLLLLLQYKV